MFPQVRQFMNGIKNYLVQHGETQLNDIIEIERGKVRTSLFQFDARPSEIAYTND